MAGSHPRRVWLVQCLACLLLWGIWGFLSKVLADQVGAVAAQILYTAGMLPVVLVAAWTAGGRALVANSRALLYALLNGSLSAAGTLAFFGALAKGPASVVSPMIAVYPLVTICLVVLHLGERISILRGCGAIAAVAGLALLS